jgi:undecaprenyl pyrophosphate synthase
MAGRSKYNITDLNIPIKDDLEITIKEAQYFQLVKNGVWPIDAIKTVWNTDDTKNIQNIRTYLYNSENIKRMKEEWGQDLKITITKELLAKELYEIIMTSSQYEKAIKIKAITELSKMLGHSTDKVDMNVNIKFGLDLEDEE